MDQFGSNNTNDLQKAIDELNAGGAGNGSAGDVGATGDAAANGASGDIGSAGEAGSADANAAAGDASADVNAIKDTFGIPPAPAIGGAFPVDQGAAGGENAGADGAGAAGDVAGSADSTGSAGSAEEKKEEKPGTFGIGSMDDSVSASIDNAISNVGAPSSSENSSEGASGAADAAGASGISGADAAGAAEAPAMPSVEAAAPTAEVSGDLAGVKKDALKELVPLLDKTELSDEKKFEVYEDVINDNHDKTMIPKALEVARRLTDEKAKAEALIKVIRWIDGQ